MHPKEGQNNDLLPQFNWVLIHSDKQSEQKPCLHLFSSTFTEVDEEMDVDVPYLGDIKELDEEDREEEIEFLPTFDKSKWEKVIEEIGDCDREEEEDPE